LGCGKRYIIAPTFYALLIMPRFYCPPPLPLTGSFDLPADAAHHAARVLRLREGDEVEIFDGAGQARTGVLIEIAGKRVVVGELADSTVERESPLRVVLAQGLPSGDKLDWVIQKATELGVSEIQPLATARSVVKLSAERAAKRQEHWQKIAISACEQCGRNVLPIIHPPQDLAKWVAQPRPAEDHKLILLPEGASALRAQAQPTGAVVLLIGAEGGFTDAESDLALQHGYTPIRMGQRVMRTETAAIAGIAALQMLWGDF
jgi:16S rRNA (uracil1498-N3)-methyltransferase